MPEAKKETKKPSIRDAIKKINKAAVNGAILSAGNVADDLQKLSSGSLSFDLPLKGGLPYGCIVSFSGVEHSGKSTAAAIMMAQYQKENPDKLCIYVDAENTLRTQGTYFQQITGISYDESCFMRYDCTGQSAEEIFKNLIELQGYEEIGMIVIDSARALISQADLDNDFTKDNGQRASIAKPLGKFIKQMMMYCPKRNNILLIINQVTVEKTMFSTIYTEPCGYALKYYPSVKLRFKTRTFTCGDKCDITESKAEQPDGIQLQFVVTKSRISGMSKDGGFITLRYATGVDKIHDMLEVALKNDFIQRPNTKTYILINMSTGEVYKDAETDSELKFGSRDDLVKYLMTHEKFVNAYIKMINEYVSEAKVSLNLLDESTINQIMEEEHGVGGDLVYTAEQIDAQDDIADDE